MGAVKALQRAIAGLLFLCVGTAAALGAWGQFTAYNTAQSGFFPAKIGGGGFVTGISIANDGSKYIRVDVYGAYYFNPTTPNCGNANATGCWQQIITSSSMPSPVTSWLAAQWNGPFELVAAPSNGAYAYMIYAGYVLATSNHGATWTQTDLARDVWAENGNNGPLRLLGYWLAVDPANTSIVVEGTSASGTFILNGSSPSATSVPPALSMTAAITTSSSSVATGTGSKTFTLAASCDTTLLKNSVGAGIDIYETGAPANQMQGTITSCNTGGSSLVISSTSSWGSGTHTDWSFNLLGNPGGTPVAYDPSSGTSGGATQGIYACPYGIGVYHSTDGGATWTLTSSGPTTCRHLIVDQFGQAWTVDNTSYALGGSKSDIWQYSSGGTPQWTNFSLGGNNANRGVSVAANPGSASKATNYVIVDIDEGIAPMFTNNNGSTWTGPEFAATTVTANDVPWLAISPGSYTSISNEAFDPSQTNMLWVATGVGTIYLTPPTSGGAISATDRTAGIENLVANWVISPWASGSSIFATTWDFGNWSIPNPNLYATQYFPIGATGLTSAFFNADWATGTPATLVTAAMEFSQDASGISTNGGASWSAFSSVPSEVSSGSYAGGGIAALDHQTFLWEVGNGGDLYCTANGGINWTEQSINSIPNGMGWPISGWGGFAYYLSRVLVAADRVNAGTGYVYNDGTTAPGIYRTTNNCTSWTQVFSGTFDNYNGDNNKFRSAPLNIGDLYYTSGRQTPAPANNLFYECQISGSSCAPTAFSNVEDVSTFSFGAPKPGGSGYPTIFIIGYVTYASNQGTAPNNCVATTWCYGIHRSDDHGATWNYLTTYPGGSLDSLTAIEGDANVYGKYYLGYSGSSFQYFMPYLLNRDLDPASNDNSPVGLAHVA